MVAIMNRILSTLFVWLCGGVAFAQTLPSGFVDEAVATIGGPTAIAFTPDGRMLVTTQGGNVRVVKNGSLLPTSALTFNTSAAGNEPKICTASERGLLGIAVDPNFVSNNYVYLFYTARNGSACETGVTYGTATVYSATGRAVNRVSRFVLGSNDLISAATETIIVNNMPSPGGNHNAGDLHFGKDGYLYISIGDGGSDYAGDSGSGGGNDAARDKHVLTGKILRVTSTGGIPPGNPFTGAGTGVCAVTGATTAGNHCQETYAWGLRNPFRIAPDPNAVGTRFYLNDVGQGVWEEVDELQAGADFGWQCREGAHDNSTTGKCNPRPPSMVDPIFEYPHGGTAVPGTTISGCNSITGGAFIPNGIWPSEYDGKYLLADYICGAIFRIPTTGTPAAPVTSATTFASGLGGSSATSLTFGPYLATQALYYTSYASGGQVRRIRYSQTSDVSVTSSPVPGLRVTVNGVTRTTPFTVAAAPIASTLNLSVRDQNLGGSGYTFASWSDAGARSHAYTVVAGNPTLTVTFTQGGLLASLDVDNDGNFDAATDGVLIARYLLGFRGAALIANAVAATGAERTDATAIESFLAAMVAAGHYDADGDAATRASTDGVLILRYLLGLTSGPGLSNAAQQPGSRVPATYLGTLKP
jgi:glucose/arabinose dehydrogenase